MHSELLTDPVWYALAFLTAFGLVLYVTPLTIRVATTFKIQDAPDGRLKKHTQPTPYLGGLAVAAAFVIAFGLLLPMGAAQDLPEESATNNTAMGILTGGFMVLLLGLYDDLTNLRPSVKFLGQVLAAVVLYKAGVQVNIAELPNWANLALTLLWVTGVANAFNIIDIMDGLAAGTACIAAVFLFLISLLIEGPDGSPVVPFMAITLAGALAGYLKFNAHPARIFLGDTGSLFIGFMMGALSMVVSYTDLARHIVVSPLVLCTPLVLLAIPLFDTVFVAFHRARKGIPFFQGSTDHFPLRLLQAGLDVPTIVRRIYAAAIVLGVLSLGIVLAEPQIVPWLLGVFALTCIAATVGFSRLPPPNPRQPVSKAVTPAANLSEVDA